MIIALLLQLHSYPFFAEDILKCSEEECHPSSTNVLNWNPRLQSPIRFGLSDTINNFSGRNQELQTLKKTLQKRIGLHLTVVSAMGGMGKTCLVRHFLNTKDVRDWNIIWLATESEQALIVSLNKACKFLFKHRDDKVIIDFSKEEIEDLLSSFYNHIRQKYGKTVIVFDNADDKFGVFDDKKLKTYFPRSCKEEMSTEFNIIVTTRRENVLQSQKPLRIKLKSLASAESISLCKTSLTIYEEASSLDKDKIEKDIERLCTCLQDYPLAIQQAIAYLNEMVGVFSISDFIEEYRKTVKIFRDKSADPKIDDYPFTVATVFDISLNKIAKTDNALEIIYILSFCDAENTEMRLFEILYGNKKAKLAIVALVKFNLITLEKSLISIHRVFQKVILDRVQERRQLIEVVFHAAMRVGCNLGTPLFDNLEGIDQNANPAVKEMFQKGWHKAQTDRKALGMVILNAVLVRNNLALEKLFSSNHWQTAKRFLDETCFSLAQGFAGYPEPVREFIINKLERNKSMRSILWETTFSALENINPGFDHIIPTILDHLRSSLQVIMNRTEISDLNGLMNWELLMRLDIAWYNVVFQRLYDQLIEEKIFPVREDFDLIWWDAALETKAAECLLHIWYFCEQTCHLPNLRDALYYVVCNLSHINDKERLNCLKIYNFHLALQTSCIDMLRRFIPNFHELQFSNIPHLKFLPEPARIKFVDKCKAGFQEMRTSLTQTEIEVIDAEINRLLIKMWE